MKMRPPQQGATFFSVPDGLKWIARRGITLYLALGLALCFLMDFDSIRSAVKFRKLQFLHPAAFTDLVAFVDRGRPLPKARWRQYAYYYENLVRYFDAGSEAHALGGFCQYYLGKPDEALALLQAAAQRNPRIFWYAYNVGAVYFNRGDYRPAADAFQRALSTNPNDTLVLMQRSKELYGPILRQAGLSAEEIALRLQQAYAECRQNLQISRQMANPMARVTAQSPAIVLRIY